MTYSKSPIKYTALRGLTYIYTCTEAIVSIQIMDAPNTSKHFSCPFEFHPAPAPLPIPGNFCSLGQVRLDFLGFYTNETMRHVVFW